MVLAIAAMGLMAAPLYAQTLIVHEVIDSFEAPFVNSFPGPIPGEPWTPFGYGSPAFTPAPPESGVTTEGAQSFRWNLPLSGIPAQCGTTPQCLSGLFALFWNVDADDLTDFPIDWSFPVTLEIDVHGDDRSVTTDSSVGQWQTFLAYNNYDKDSENPVEWGDNGQTNGTTTTASIVLSPGQGLIDSGTLHFGIAFAFDTNDTTSTDVNAAIFDNLRITYTTPEVICSRDPVFDLTSVGDPGQPDGAVDELDFNVFASTCFTGPAAGTAEFEALSTECKCVDVNEDQSVDLKDFAGFQRCIGLSGAALEACDD
jgi:hypothetical protein